ncbi:MAG: Lrp/AsnC family transcriptional regulator [Nitrososphaera sp.]|jgi:DNA-binding Lrp family transcriptional regulator|uniref:Lrp/AsnC family transcriptional regulator n=1 Tax=Nitrososphaera sp. TaxID=1971748 RepID=UPI003D6DB659
MLIEEQHGKLDTKSVSRQEIIKELETLGINASSFHQLSINELQDLLKTVMQMVNDSKQRKRNAKRGDKEQTPVLSPVDKKILKTLLSSTGEISSLTLSRELDIPLSTVQRRRKRLEADFLEASYSPKLEKLGWRVAMLFVHTEKGNTIGVGKEILSWKDSTVRVWRAIGAETTDIITEAIFKENKDLMDIIERVKAIKGVTNISWIELVSTLGKNDQCFESIIDKM